MTTAFPGESAEYRAARNDLLVREIELRRAAEAVAAARRALPPGGIISTDYVFHREGADGAPEPVRMSELFEGGKDSLVTYHWMFGPQRERPCPSCCAFLDSLDGAALHVGQRVNLVVVAKSPVERMRAVANERGWQHLRLVSSGGTTFKRDYLSEQEDPPNIDELPLIHVFHRDGDTIRHIWGSEMIFHPSDPGQDPRHNGTLDLLWNVWDLTPEGRGMDWSPQLSYA